MTKGFFPSNTYSLLSKSNEDGLIHQEKMSDAHMMWVNCLVNSSTIYYLICSSTKYNSYVYLNNSYLYHEIISSFLIDILCTKHFFSSCCQASSTARTDSLHPNYVLFLCCCCLSRHEHCIIHTFKMTPIDAYGFIRNRRHIHFWNTIITSNAYCHCLWPCLMVRPIKSLTLT